MSERRRDPPALDPRATALPRAPVPQASTAARPPHAPWSKAAGVFMPGEVAAGRFRIVRLVARGGMGEVYEAEDLDLHIRVALKTIRPELTADPGALERFKREVHLARQVTHANVCRLFDFGEHRWPAAGTRAGSRTTGVEADGGTAGAHFITMEFLDGDNLREYLDSTGKLTTSAALPIIEQIAAALSCAHRVGVVHRDLKSGNVILVRADSQEQAMRAVVVDFGIAVGQQTAGQADPAGTPAYMAPEQLEGGDITPATDLYALGVLMLEMLTGRTPDVDRAQTVVLRPRVPANGDVRIVEGLDPIWEAAILRCLARDPRHRFQSADDLLRALTESRSRARPTLAVLRFDVAAESAGVGEHRSWVGTVFEEVLAAALAAADDFRVIPSDDVALALADLGIAGAASTPEALADLSARLGAELLVLGSCRTDDAELSATVRLVDARARRQIETVVLSGPPGRLFELTDEVTNKLRAALGLSALTRPELQRARARFPERPEALELYAQGLTKLRMYEDVAAVEALEAAVAADPSHPAAHEALAQSWSRLGADVKAQASARRAFALSNMMPRVDQLRIEARYRAATREWARAIDIHRALWVLFPDRLETGLDLVDALRSAERLEDAGYVLSQLRALPHPAGDDARLDYLEARMVERHGDYERALAAARAAREKALLQGARSLAASCLHLEAEAVGRLQGAEKGLEAVREALRIHRDVGNHLAVAQALLKISTLLGRSEQPEAADEALEEAIELLRSIGARSELAIALLIRGRRLQRGGQLEAAWRHFEEALALSRASGSRRGEWSAFDAMADHLSHRGKKSEAMHALERALEIARQAGNLELIATSLKHLGGRHLELGEYAAARRRLEEALSLEQRMRDRLRRAHSLRLLGITEIYLGELDSALTRLDESAAAFEQVGDPAYTPDVLWRQAMIHNVRGNLDAAQERARRALERSADAWNRAMALHELAWTALTRADFPRASRLLVGATRAARAVGRSAAVIHCRWLEVALLAEQSHEEAIARARTLLEDLKATGSAENAASGLYLVAHALLAGGDSAEAKAFALDALGLLPQFQNPLTACMIRVVAGRALAAGGDPEDAAAQLHTALEESRRSGYAVWSHEARIELAALDLAAGGDDARGRLAALAHEAGERGYGLLARRAHRHLARAADSRAT